MNEIDDGFPKKVGIIFLEKVARIEERQIKRILKFDQQACAYLILQMNRVQNVFDFQLITLFPDRNYPPVLDNFSLPDKNSPTNLNYFDTEISKIKDIEDLSYIDYWIGITSEIIDDHYFFKARNKRQNKSRNNIGLITSENWEREFSPPSLFEYITISVLACSLYLLDYDFNGKLKFHETKGCIFDFTDYKPHRKILVSNPNLCSTCKQEIGSLEAQIGNTNRVHLSQKIEQALSREWMGNPEERETPFYNLQRIYRYNIDQNSGFYKNWKEKFRESISNRLAEWTIGNILGGIIGGIIVGIFVTISKIKP